MVIFHSYVTNYQRVIWLTDVDGLGFLRVPNAVGKLIFHRIHKNGMTKNRRRVRAYPPMKSHKLKQNLIAILQ